MKKVNLFRAGLFAAAFLTMTACSNDDDAADVTNPPIENQAGHLFSIHVDLNNTKTRVALTGTDDGGAKAEWETGDRIYMKYTKDGADGFFEFNMSAIDAMDKSKATFTCVDFTFPTDATDITFIYAGKKDVDSVVDLALGNFLANQTQTGNNGWASVGQSIYMLATTNVNSEEALQTASLTFAHQNSITSFVIEEPYNWGDKATQLVAKLISSTATLTGCADNTVTLNLTDAAWDDHTLTAHIAVAMEGALGNDDHWELSLLSENNFTATVKTKSAAQQDNGMVYVASLAMPEVFPMADFDPTVNGEGGTWDEATQTFFVNARLAGGGWRFAEGLDLSHYTKLRIEIGDETDFSAGLEIRFYGTDASTWSGDAAYVLNLEAGTNEINLADVATTLADKGGIEQISTIATYIGWGGAEDPSGLKVIIKRVSLVQDSTNPDPNNPSFPNPSEPTPGDGSLTISIPSFGFGGTFA